MGVGDVPELVETPTIEPTLVPDLFVHDIARFEPFGSWVRAVFHTPQLLDGGAMQHVTTAKVILPREKLEAIGNAFLAAARALPDTIEDQPRGRRVAVM